MEMDLADPKGFSRCIPLHKPSGSAKSATLNARVLFHVGFFVHTRHILQEEYFV